MSGAGIGGAGCSATSSTDLGNAMLCPVPASGMLLCAMFGTEIGYVAFAMPCPVLGSACLVLIQGMLLPGLEGVERLY